MVALLAWIHSSYNGFKWQARVMAKNNKKVCWNLWKRGLCIVWTVFFTSSEYLIICAKYGAKIIPFFDTFLWKKIALGVKAQGSSDKPSSSQRNYDSGLLGAEKEVHTVVWHCYRATKSPDGGGRDGWMIQQGVRLWDCFSLFWPNPNLNPKALSPEPSGT